MSGITGKEYQQRGLHRKQSAAFTQFRRHHPTDTERIATGYADLIKSYLGSDYNGTYLPVIDRTEDERYYGDSAAVAASTYYRKHYEGVDEYEIV
jgi:hypothetical protein